MIKPLGYYLSYLTVAEADQLEQTIRALEKPQELAFVVSLAARAAFDPTPLNFTSRDELVQKVLALHPIDGAGLITWTAQLMRERLRRDQDQQLLLLAS